MGTSCRILGKASSINVRKVLWTCEELDLSYQQEDWGSGFQSTHSPEFLALNPNAQVPVLIDEAGALWESNSICRYLANLYPGSGLLPIAPRARALVEQWMDWQATELNPAWSYAFMGLVRHHPDCQDSRRIGASLMAWNGKMAILERQLESTGNYVLGEDFSLADIVLGLSVNRWKMTPMEHPDFPAVAAYYERLSLRPGFVLHGRNGTP
ncbi:glutathione S-transferase [Pseudomonas chlororaphis]|uniref:glutathione S-transferase family protein n=1 Tax=Pseudomonas chlororaphis TaxID=587753 RepID=UPI00209A86AB|nr:glutathione S-transferase [Pseudomonas chlororaphis]MCO7571288.1 glutathione S-transferase [Pseudomonas chlororaphis]MCO7589512.1 glutathione S-transferase [Pseudomonas chlororaphis]